MSDRSYISLDTCIVCGEAKGVLLDRKLNPRFERKTITSLEPCEKCNEKYLTEGVMLVYIGDNDYDLLVIKDEAFERLFNREVPPGMFPTNRIMRCEKEVISEIKSCWAEQSKEENK
jgi:hypothetical protein